MMRRKRSLPLPLGVLVVLATLVPAVPASADDPVAVVVSPRQAVPVVNQTDDSAVPGTFRSNLHVLADGRARGRAVLEHEEDGELVQLTMRYGRGKLTETDDGPVATFEAEGELCRSSGRCQDLPLTGSVRREAGGGIILYDIQDGFVYDPRRVEARGTFVVFDHEWGHGFDS